MRKTVFCCIHMIVLLLSSASSSSAHESEDRDLRIRAEGNKTSPLFDNSGSEHAASQAALGKRAGGRDARKMMIAGIPIEESVRFQGLAKDASSIAVLQIACLVNDDASFKFRNVPLVEK